MSSQGSLYKIKVSFIKHRVYSTITNSEAGNSDLSWIILRQQGVVAGSLLSQLKGKRHSQDRQLTLDLNMLKLGREKKF